MNRYATIVSVWWQRALTYRNLVLTYRIADITETLILIALWLRIFETHDTVRGFTQNEMLTYVLVGGFFFIVTRNFAAETVAADIHEGHLSMFLTKPISYLNHYTAMIFGRSLHILLGGITQLIMIALFHRYLVANVDVTGMVLIAAMLILGFYSEILISYLIGLIAFWTEEVDGLYSSISQIRRFLSGYYFPLSILPAALASAAYWTPFAYRYFVPVQIFLGKIDTATGVKGVAIAAGWIVVLHIIIRIVWARGLKRYESVNT